MKTVLLTPARSSDARDRSGTDSYYFPGCRKDTNCSCEMCLASINATLDLVSSRTTLQLRSPVSVDSASVLDSRAVAPATPELGIRRRKAGAGEASPPLRSTAKSRAAVAEERRDVKRSSRRCSVPRLLVWVLVLGSVWAVDVGAPAAVLWVTGGARLSPVFAMMTGEEAMMECGLKAKLRFLEDKLKLISGGDVTNCSSDDSKWEFQQDGDLLHMKCTLYKSMAEEVSIWGYPLQTSGRLTTGLSPRTLTIVSGAINEWSAGELEYRRREAGSSWMLERWTASAVQLEANTWMLEYRRNPFMQEPRLVAPLAKDFLKVKISELVRKLNRADYYWLLEPPLLLRNPMEDPTPPT